MNWKSLNIDGAPFVCRIDNNCTDMKNYQSLITIWLSDFRLLYKEVLRLNELLSRARVENPIVEYDSSIILDTILCGNAPQIQFVPDAAGSIFRLKCKYYVSQLPFHFHWEMKQQSPDVFYDKITRVLMSSLLDANAQRQHLMEIIAGKDSEIEQYKLDGAELIRKHLATAPFDRDSFEHSAKTQAMDSFVEIAKLNAKELGIKAKWMPEQRISSTPVPESTLLSPTKRASSSPGKAAKRLTKEMLVRSKIQSGPDATVEYADEDEDVVTPEQHTPTRDQLNPSVEGSAAQKVDQARTPTNVRKINTKLNL